MLGAILGDIIGSPYEFDYNNIKTTKFPLFSARSRFTDDTVMTIAVAEGLMKGWGNDADMEDEIIKSMQKWGKAYPYAGYGGNFSRWIEMKNPKPYGSYGNGSAMRVSSAGWLCSNLPEVLHVAELTAKVTHNHPEGIKGAQSTAAAIFLARNGAGKEEIKKYIADTFHYDFSRTLNEIRTYYHHVESCQETVPEAFTAFFEGNDFEEVVRKAVSLGGDSDTLTAIAGSIAEAFYGIPEDLREKAIEMLDEPMKDVLVRFRDFSKREN